MRLTSYLDRRGDPRLAVTDTAGALRDVTGAAVGDHRHAGISPIRQFLERGESWRSLAAAAAVAREAEVETLLPPVPDPTKIVAAPVNYRDHQVEMSEDTAVDGLGVFLKAPSSLLPDGGMVRLPYHDRRFDQEGELAVVIGRRASNVSIDDALGVVAGYTCLLDMTMRGGEDRSVRKSFDTFTPAGPQLVTADEVGPVDALELRTWVGGRIRQEARLCSLIWNVPRLVAYVSSVMVLLPGDLIATGTPAGVGPVGDGDQIVLEITNVGRLRVSVSSTGAVACPTTGQGRGPVPPTWHEPRRQG